MHGINNVTLNIVRELGFNTEMGLNRPSSETVFFLGPSSGYREDGASATPEAVLEFISHCEHQAKVAREYLANGRNNKTHEWERTVSDGKYPSVEAISVVQEIFRNHGMIGVKWEQLEHGARIIDNLVSERIARSFGNKQPEGVK